MTSTLAAPTTAALADLLLLRMTVSKVTPKQLRTDIGKLMEAEMSAGEFDDMRNELASAGLLMKGKRNTFTLTDAGRERALELLGIAELPPRTTWKTVIARYVFPKAAGLSLAAAAKLDDGDKLAAFLLKRKYKLGAGTGSTVKQVIEALACRELKFPGETTLEGLVCAVLSKLMGVDRLSREQLVKQLPLFETGLPALSAEAVRRKVVREWLSMASSAPSRHALLSEPFDLPAFAATVRALAASSPPQDRFHNNKVFIAALWRASQREPNLQRFTLPEFKQRLIEANAQHLLHLSRADLVQAMDPQSVAESETVHQNATFHFVLPEGGRS